MVYLMPDQKTARIVKILVEEYIPLFDVLKVLLSDRGTNLLGTNLLSYLMKDICGLLGIKYNSLPPTVQWADWEV